MIHQSTLPDCLIAQMPRLPQCGWYQPRHMTLVVVHTSCRWWCGLFHRKDPSTDIEGRLHTRRAAARRELCEGARTESACMHRTAERIWLQ